MENNYSVPIADAVDSYLAEEDWRYTFDEERGTFRFTLCRKGIIKEVNFTVEIGDDSYTVRGSCPVVIGGRRVIYELADFVCRVNNLLSFDGFRFDPESGRLSCVYTANCSFSLPFGAYIKNSISRPAEAFDAFSAGIFAVVINGVSGREAAARCGA